MFYKEIDKNKQAARLPVLYLKRRLNHVYSSKI